MLTRAPFDGGKHRDPISAFGTARRIGYGERIVFLCLSQSSASSISCSLSHRNAVAESHVWMPITWSRSPLHMSSLKACDTSCRSNFSRSSPRRLNFLFPAYFREPSSTHCLSRRPRPACQTNPSTFPVHARIFKPQSPLLIVFQTNTMSQAPVSSETLIGQCSTVTPLHPSPGSHGAVH